MPKNLPALCLRHSRNALSRTGYSPITREGRTANRGGFDAKMDFGILHLARGQRLSERTTKECLWVLINGRAKVTVDGKSAEFSRGSLFEEGPSALHAGRGEDVEIISLSASEWAVTATSNSRRLGGRLYLAADTATEDRGNGLAQGACRRLVRTIFDFSTRPEANLVAGEVVNYPGRWSTYPPHHHSQPEIYHYRFTLPQGYGHSEIGENVYKVRGGDTVKIPGGLDHSQVSAPGYGMYYLWVIRHLPGDPYKGFTFTQEHKWLLDPKNQGWVPSLPSK
jgi:5-deoxy-glucuronate isomerase